MAHLMRSRGWKVPDRNATPENIFHQRRSLVKAIGLFGIGATTGVLAACGPARDAAKIGAQEQPPGLELYPAQTDRRFNLDRPLTDESYAASYNNFYEFSTFKSSVYKKASRLRTNPWQVQVTGLVEKPRTFDIDELVRAMPLEERLYRFRCVEAWAMAVPWTGFTMNALIRVVQPLSAATHVRFISFLKPDEAPNQSPSYGPWPYTEGLTLAEVTNELSLLATGIYGHPLPKQNGAPLRLVTPWKYGFKNIKSIVKIEFSAAQPRTFWHSNRPSEYGFTANVDPKVPHPRWSQEMEKLIDTGERRKTLPFNGYQEWVAQLYT